MKFRLRHLWLQVHLYLGLTAGLLFALAGLTGSVIVFDHAIDERLNASMMLTAEQGSPRPLTEIVASAEAAPNVSGRASGIAYPRVANGTFTVSFKPKGQGGEAAITEVFVDPATAQVLGQRLRGSGLMATIYRLHATLLSGKPGEIVLGVMATLVLVSVVSGVVLWWSLIHAGIRAAFAIRRQKFNFDLHKTVGIVFTPVLFLIAWTGTHLTLPGVVRPVVTTVFPETKLPQKVKSKPPAEGARSLTADQAAAVAQERMPGCRLMSVELPAGPDDSFRVFVRQVGEVGDLRGVGRVWVDRYDGEVLATRDWEQFTLADTYFRIQLALHSGDAFGMTGRWLFCAAGLIPALLYVTGFALWWRKRQSRLRQQRHIAARPLVSGSPPREQVKAPPVEPIQV